MSQFKMEKFMKDLQKIRKKYSSSSIVKLIKMGFFCLSSHQGSTIFITGKNVAKKALLHAAHGDKNYMKYM